MGGAPSCRKLKPQEPVGSVLLKKIHRAVPMAAAKAAAHPMLITGYIAAVLGGLLLGYIVLLIIEPSGAVEAIFAVLKSFFRFPGKLMLKYCGKDVNIEKGAVFSARTSLGDYSGIGINARIIFVHGIPFLSTTLFNSSSGGMVSGLSRYLFIPG